MNKQKLEVGDVVNFHNNIDGEIISRDHKIKLIKKLSDGQEVAWVTGIEPYVCIEALSEKEV